MKRVIVWEHNGKITHTWDAEEVEVVGTSIRLKDADGKTHVVTLDFGRYKVIDLENPPVIRLYFCDPCVLTAEDFEKLAREVTSRVMASIPGIADRVCLQLLHEHYGRYHLVKTSMGEEPDSGVASLVERWTKLLLKREFADHHTIKGGT